MTKTGGADIFELWGGWILDISPTGALSPVPDAFIRELKTDSYDMVLGGFEYNGKYYGVPIEMNQEGGGMLVLKPYFDSHNIKYPTTWNELVSIAKANSVSQNGVFSKALPYAKPIIDIIDGANYMGYINTSVLKRVINNAFVDMVQNGTPAATAVKKINADLEPYYK